MRKLFKIGLWLMGTLAVLAALVYLMAYKPVPEQISYGMSFNTPYARELGLASPEGTAAAPALGTR